MAKRTVEVIDGFSQVQAFKRATAKGTTVTPAKAKPATKEVTSSTNEVAPSRAVASARSRVATSTSRAMPVTSTTPASSIATPMKSIGVTVAPKKRVVTCYSCGYSFTAAGKLHVPYCPKCKLMLCVDNIVIDGEQNEDIKTIGNVVIKPTAKLSEGLIINGSSVTIGGDVSKCAAVLASEQICLETGAIFSPSVLERSQVVIPNGAEIKVVNEIKCVRLIVFGKITGAIQVSEGLEIKSGGHVVGDVVAPTLVMELGAGLTGACKIVK